MHSGCMHSANFFTSGWRHHFETSLRSADYLDKRRVRKHGWRRVVALSTEISILKAFSVFHLLFPSISAAIHCNEPLYNRYKCISDKFFSPTSYSATMLRLKNWQHHFQRRAVKLRCKRWRNSHQLWIKLPGMDGELQIIFCVATFILNSCLYFMFLRFFSVIDKNDNKNFSLMQISICVYSARTFVYCTGCLGFILYEKHCPCCWAKKKMHKLAYMKMLRENFFRNVVYWREIKPCCCSKHPGLRLLTSISVHLFIFRL